MIGDQFQEETKYKRDQMSDIVMDWTTKPETYKEYPGSAKIELPTPPNFEGLSLDYAIRNRKSVRRYKNISLSQEYLSYLLWASTGIRAAEGGHEFRTTPSAGALYPIETYLVINNVTDIPAGVYHYNVRRHALESLKHGNHGIQTAEAAMEQGFCATAAVTFIWTAVFERSKWKYKDRAYRYVYLDAGHIAQNLAITASAMSLGTCQIAANFDEEVNDIIRVDGKEESVIYMSALGYPA